MSLEQSIMADLKTAMLTKNEAGLRAIRAIKSAILLAKTSAGGKELSEEDEVKMLQKLVKQRQESISIYETQQREDLAAPEREEVAIISKYLPEMMSEEDVRKAVKAAIEQTGAKSAAEMGKVMGVVTKALAGKADNKMVSALVKELLS
ncbi:MAG: GatB/YqeY domain-containing protein [Bacteroidia bacterium]|nr:GatB/YqeY domain-containing protein [Bacteroidota bacterium]MBP6513278.1 GatB/YqeY domain-containing protein [Bacteroidia bacterium]MBP7244984.1 GatB/YqeY domain-containing protein [Bacteroidia bacterium]